MKKIELKYIGPTSGDCTAPYSVEINTENITVEEFIVTIIKENPKDWGYIGIRSDNGINNDTIFGNPVCEYKYGKILYDIDDDVKNKKIVFAKASGGWSRMDYLLDIK